MTNLLIFLIGHKTSPTLCISEGSFPISVLFGEKNPSAQQLKVIYISYSPVQSNCCHFSSAQFLFFCVVGWFSFVATTKLCLFGYSSFLKATPGQTFYDSGWVYTPGFCSFCADGNTGHLQISNVAGFYKRTCTVHLKPKSALNFFPGRHFANAV